MDNHLIVDGSTGEQIGELNPGDRIVHASTVTRYREWIEQQHVDKDKWVMTDFLKISAQEQQLWNKDLSLNEKAFLFSIQPYLSFDNDLCDDKGVQLGTEELIYLTGISRRTAFTVIKSLTSKFILYQGKNGRGRQYIINPWIMCKGVYVKRDYQALFRDYRIRMLSGKRWGDLKGFQK
jgi:hypothetical protein